MIPLLILAIVLTGAMAALAYTLATYALPFMAALAVARFAYATGAGFVGAGIVGLLGGVAFYGLLAYLFGTLRSPALRLAIAAAFALPAAICRLFPCAWRHAGSRSLRSLAATVLPCGRRIRWHVGAGAAGRSGNVPREGMMRAGV